MVARRLWPRAGPPPKASASRPGSISKLCGARVCLVDAP
jgi:hypothetical protein